MEMILIMFPGLRLSPLVVNLVVLMKIPIWSTYLGWDCVKYYLCYSGFSEGLVLLTIFIYKMTNLSSPASPRPGSTNLCLMWGLVLILVACFRVSSVFYFYFLFEASLLPMFFLILGWGYQPERLPAGVCLLLYTVLASLPLLLLLASLSTNESASSLISLSAPGGPFIAQTGSLVIGTAAIVGFLVKMPMFWFHLWLPKAHVEAPVAGSMVLASVLLKLGGYGLFRLFKVIDVHTTWTSEIASFAILGGAWMSFLCAYQTDMKVLIAYSSVAHMSMVIYGLLSGAATGLWASVSLMLAHGVVSSGLFMGANLLYARSFTRSLMVTKSFVNVLPSFSLFWFILCVANMGGPPTLNLVSEIVSFILAYAINLSSVLPYSIMAALAVAYSLTLFSLSQHGASTKLANSPKPLTMSELTNLFYHSLLSVLLVSMVAILLS